MKETSKADELWDKLEGLVDQWQATTADGHRALADQISKAKDQLEAFLGDIQAQDEAAATTARSSMTALQGIRKTLVKEAEAQARVEELERDLEDRGKALEAERVQQIELKGLLSERSGEIQAAQRRIAELESVASEHVGAAEESQKQLANLEQSHGDKEASLQAARERVAALEKTLADETENGDGLKERLAGLETSLDEKTKSLEAASGRVEELETAMAADAQTQDAAKGQVAEVEQALAKQTKAAEDGAKRADDLDSELQRLKEDADALRARESDSHEERTALDGELDQLRAASEEAMRAKEASDAQLAEVTAEAKNLRAELDAAQASVERATELEQQLQAVEDKSLLLAERLEGEVAQGSKSGLATELAQALEANERAHQEIGKLKLQHARLQRDAVKTATGQALVKDSLNVAGADREGKPRKLGDILLEVGSLTEEQLGEALQEQKSNPTQHLGGILVKNGVVDEEAVGKALACQGDFDFIVLDERTVDPGAAELISERVASLHTCIPIRATEESLVLAMTNPFDLVAIEDIERACERHVEPVVAKPSEISAAIERCYS
jgi:chromosome segregation ATPase